MKVILRINKGIMTRKVNVPDKCVATDFRVPVGEKIIAHNIGIISEYPKVGVFPRYLVFRWDRISMAGGGLPIMDLVDIT